MNIVIKSGRGFSGIVSLIELVVSCKFTNNVVQSGEPQSPLIHLEIMLANSGTMLCRLVNFSHRLSDKKCCWQYIQITMWLHPISILINVRKGKFEAFVAALQAILA